MKTILITGASGLIGTRLSQMLKEKKYNVKHLSRGLRTAKKFPLYLWKPETGFIDPKAFEQTDVIIHLAGVPLDQKRWSAAQKTKLLESRSASAHLLWQYVTQLSNKPECFISASGTNYYGSYTRKKAFTEEGSLRHRLSCKTMSVMGSQRRSFLQRRHSYDKITHRDGSLERGRRFKKNRENDQLFSRRLH